MERQTLLLKDEMNTEQIAHGIPDMLILMEEIVKTAERKLVFSKTSNAFVEVGIFLVRFH